MTLCVDYFFTCLSPFAYLGHRTLVALAQRQGVTINYLPVALGEVWRDSGAVPVPQRPVARQRYRLIELQRWRAKRAVPLNLKPAHFPTDPTLADRVVIAVGQAGIDPGPVALAMAEALWVHERDIAIEATLVEVLRGANMDAQALLAAAKGEAVEARHGDNTRRGVALGIIGSPCYVYQGEPFWGQDRLELLEEAMASKRPPFQVPEA